MRADEIIREVAKAYGLGPRTLRSRNRKRKFAWPRQEAYWRLRQELVPGSNRQRSLPEIASLFGRDHTTILHGIKKHQERMGL